MVYSNGSLRKRIDIKSETFQAGDRLSTGRGLKVTIRRGLAHLGRDEAVSCAVRLLRKNARNDSVRESCRTGRRWRYLLTITPDLAFLKRHSQLQ